MFSVDTVAVKGHAGSLQETLTSFGQNSTEFDSAMEELLGSMKDGAESEFQNLHSQWMDAAKQVEQGLEKLGLDTEELAQIFNEGIEEQAEQVRAAASQMNFHSGPQAV